MLLRKNRKNDLDDIKKVIDASLKSTREEITNNIGSKILDNTTIQQNTITNLTQLNETKLENIRKSVEEKLTAKNVQNQNANVDERSFGGRMGEATSYMTKDYALKYLVSDKARKHHLENRIYIHDLDHYAVGSHNCLSIPFDDLLAKGFNTR